MTGPRVIPGVFIETPMGAGKVIARDDRTIFDMQEKPFSRTDITVRLADGQTRVFTLAELTRYRRQREKKK